MRIWATAWCRGPATLTDGKLAGRWPARDPGVMMVLAGEVAASGAVTIEMHTEDASGAWLRTIDMLGTLANGRLDATGSFGGGRKVVSIGSGSSGLRRSQAAGFSAPRADDCFPRFHTARVRPRSGS